MDFFPRIHRRISPDPSLDPPLPTNVPDAAPEFQEWHEFDESSRSWEPLDANNGASSAAMGTTRRRHDGDTFTLVTWNIMSNAILPGLRSSAIITHILGLSPAVDIIFLQEVARPALSAMLGDPRIREGWVCSDSDAPNWGGQSFGTITLLSRARFAYPDQSSEAARLGPVWRVRYPSRFERDALFCDILLPSPKPSTSERIRLSNVHLDSLAINPSRRPQQLSIITSYLRAAGRGLVAGDFNPVCPEDKTLVEDNGLVDAWIELRGEEDGFTWGIDGKKRFPANRLDKIATLFLQTQDIDVMHPDPNTKSSSSFSNSTGDQGPTGDIPVPWSDHSGLRCSFRAVAED